LYPFFFGNILTSNTTASVVQWLA